MRWGEGGKRPPGVGVLEGRRQEVQDLPPSLQGEKAGTSAAAKLETAAYKAVF